MQNIKEPICKAGQQKLLHSNIIFCVNGHSYGFLGTCECIAMTGCVERNAKAKQNCI